MKILVTGASGFIGREIVALLVQTGHEVFSLIGSQNIHEGDLPNIIQSDITDFELLKKKLRHISPDVIIHSAGLAHQFKKIPDEEFINVNCGGTENLARLGKDLAIRHFILISSVAVYGNTDKTGLVDETNLCRPLGIYAESKYRAELIAQQVCSENNIALTILRPVTVIGENDRGNTARLVESIRRKRFFWIGNGENLKSLIYKKDVARACLKVLEKKYVSN